MSELLINMVSDGFLKCVKELGLPKMNSPRNKLRVSRRLHCVTPIKRNSQILNHPCCKQQRIPI